MKNVLTILLAVSGIGALIWAIKKFSAPDSRPSQSQNTGTASALDPFYRLWGQLRTPRSTGSQAPDQTGQLITAGAGALTSTVKSLKDLITSGNKMSPTAQVISPGIIYQDQPYATSVDTQDIGDYDWANWG